MRPPAKGLTMSEQENRQVVERLRALMAAGDLEAAEQEMYEIEAEDFVQYWPQSGEIIRGREASRALNKAYSANTGMAPKMKTLRLLGGPDVYTVEGTIDYGDGTPVSYVGIFEFRDGKLARATEYFANPFEAPAWRAKFAQQADYAAATA